jgi:ubiquitin-activating enzyme E1 C
MITAISRIYFLIKMISSTVSRPKDIGRPKVEVAAEFVMKRVPGVTVVPYFGKIQDKDDDYYSQFSIIICGLDSVEARRWINATITGMYDEEDPSTIKPIVDGGTEGFKGQSRIIIPKMTACYECSLDMQTKPTSYPVNLYSEGYFCCINLHEGIC